MESLHRQSPLQAKSAAHGWFASSAVLTVLIAVCAVVLLPQRLIVVGAWAVEVCTAGMSGTVTLPDRAEITDCAAGGNLTFKVANADTASSLLVSGGSGFGLMTLAMSPARAYCVTIRDASFSYGILLTGTLPKGSEIVVQGCTISTTAYVFSHSSSAAVVNGVLVSIRQNYISGAGGYLFQMYTYATNATLLAVGNVVTSTGNLYPLDTVDSGYLFNVEFIFLNNIFRGSIVLFRPMQGSVVPSFTQPADPSLVTEEQARSIYGKCAMILQGNTVIATKAGALGVYGIIFSESGQSMRRAFDVIAIDNIFIANTSGFSWNAKFTQTIAYHPIKFIFIGNSVSIAGKYLIGAEAAFPIVDGSAFVFKDSVLTSTATSMATPYYVVLRFAKRVGDNVLILVQNVSTTLKGTGSTSSLTQLFHMDATGYTYSTTSSNLYVNMCANVMFGTLLSTSVQVAAATDWMTTTGTIRQRSTGCTSYAHPFYNESIIPRGSCAHTASVSASITPSGTKAVTLSSTRYLTGTDTASLATTPSRTKALTLSGTRSLTVSASIMSATLSPSKTHALSRSATRSLSKTMVPTHSAATKSVSSSATATGTATSTGTLTGSAIRASASLSALTSGTLTRTHNADGQSFSLHAYTSDAQTAVAVLGVGVGGLFVPAAAMQQGVAMALLRMSECKGGDEAPLLNDGGGGEALPFLVHPLRFSVGGGPARYARGAILGDVVLLPFAWALSAFFVAPFVIAVARGAVLFGDTRACSVDLEPYRVDVGWPGVLVVPFTVVGEGAMSCAVALLSSDEWCDVLVGVAGLTVLVAVAVGWARELLEMRRGIGVPRRQLAIVQPSATAAIAKSSPHRLEGCVLWLLAPRWMWSMVARSEPAQHGLVVRSLGGGGASDDPMLCKKDSGSAERSAAESFHIEEVLADLFLAKRLPLVGDSWWLWSAIAGHCFSMLVGLAEGLPVGTDALCRLRWVLAAVGAVGQSVVVLTSATPAALGLLGASSLVCCFLVVFTALSTFRVVESSETLTDAANGVGTLNASLGILLMCVGIAGALVPLLQRRCNAHPLSSPSSSVVLSVTSHPAVPLLAFDCGGGGGISVDDDFPAIELLPSIVEMEEREEVEEVPPPAADRLPLHGGRWSAVLDGVEEEAAAIRRRLALAAVVPSGRDAEHHIGVVL